MSEDQVKADQPVDTKEARDGEPARGEGAQAEAQGDRGAGKGKKRERMTYEIDIFRAWCKACGICAAFCPRQCIELDEEGSPVVTAPERCTGCGFCEIHCPDFAISVVQKRAKRTEEDEAADA
jgi:2-oxoglutarate ferredoxin oxidoreductase subunit delta